MMDNRGRQHRAQHPPRTVGIATDEINEGRITWVGHHPCETPPMTFVMEFIEEKVKRVAQAGDKAKAHRALVEARWMCFNLNKWGYTEFEPYRVKIDEVLTRVRREILHQLAQEYLTRGPKAAECERVMIEVIRDGHWPTWEEDYEEEIQRYAAERAMQRLEGPR
jgi:hypothetical protein